MTKDLLELVGQQINEERRRRNRQLLSFVKGEIDLYNAEDLMRLVGSLNAAYDHIVASMAAEPNIYCVLKHLATAIILAGEVDGDAEAIYQAMSALTDGKIEPCEICKKENKEEE